jgi:HAD superfamily hydrolase (TIGR01458 family)
MTIAYLLDLEGTLYTDRGVIPGGPEAIAALRGRGIPFRCVSNTTTRSRAALATRLSGFGYDIPASDILTPVSAAVAHCAAHGLTRVAAFVPEAALADLTGLEVVPSGRVGGRGPAGTPAAILIGDLGEGWTFALLQEAFTHVMAGAEIIALSRDRYFMRDGRLTLDAGPFVAGLEYATGRPATVVGKPSATFFQMARRALPDTDEVVMVGDDLWSDIQGAQRSGLTAWLVRTGKFREDTLRESGVTPDRILDSVAELGSEK